MSGLSFVANKYVGISFFLFGDNAVRVFLELTINTESNVAVDTVIRPIPMWLSSNFDWACLTLEEIWNVCPFTKRRTYAYVMLWHSSSNMLVIFGEGVQGGGGVGNGIFLRCVMRERERESQKHQKTRSIESQVGKKYSPKISCKMNKQSSQNPDFPEARFTILIWSPARVEFEKSLQISMKTCVMECKYAPRIVGSDFYTCFCIQRHQNQVIPWSICVCLVILHRLDQECRFGAKTLCAASVMFLHKNDLRNPKIGLRLRKKEVFAQNLGECVHRRCSPPPPPRVRGKNSCFNNNKRVRLTQKILHRDDE